MIFRRTYEHRNFANVSRIYWKDVPYSRSKNFDICVGYARNHGNITNHCHDDFFEMVLVTNGTATNFLEGTPYPILEGSVFVIHPRQQHGYSGAKNLDLFNICIRESALDRLPEKLLASSGYVAFFRVEPAFRHKKKLPSQLVLSTRSLDEVAHTADRLRSALAASDPLNEIRAFAIFIDLLAKISIEYQSPKHTPASQISLHFARVISFIEKNFADPITVADIARHSGLSMRSLHRACLAYAGSPPKQFLTDVRLEHAKRILAEGSESVTETAFASGFSDSNHFSKYFKSKTGYSPREFRARQQKAV